MQRIFDRIDQKLGLPGDPKPYAFDLAGLQPDQPEISRPPLYERYSDGIAVPFDSFFFRSTGGDNFSIKPSEVYAFISVALEHVVDSELVHRAVLRSSSVMDCIDAADHDVMSRRVTTRLIPWKFPVSVRDLSAGNKQVMMDLMSGSDIDIRVGVDNFKSWVDSLIGKTRDRMEGPVSIISETDSETVVEIKPKMSVIDAWPVDHLLEMSRITVVAMTQSAHTPIIQITRGMWPNGIPFCEYTLLARSREYGRPDIKLVSIGYAPIPQDLSPLQQAQDTRTAPWVNSHDRTFADISLTLPEQFDVDGVHGTVPGRYLWNSSMKVEEQGVMRPAFGGFWKDRTRVIPYQGRPLGPNIFEAGPLGRLIARVKKIPQTEIDTRRQRYDAIDPFIYLSPETLQALEQPIQFGEDLFESTTPENAICEVFRVLRKSLRYGSILKDDRYDHNRAVLAGEELVNGRDVIADLLIEAHDSGHKPYWYKDVERELLTSSFFAPRELVEEGSALGIDRMLPNWHYLVDSKSLIPDRGQLRKAMVSDMQLRTYGSDGWHRILDAVRQQFPDDVNITSRKNDLELIIWLFSIHPE